MGSTCGHVRVCVCVQAWEVLLEGRSQAWSVPCTTHLLISLSRRLGHLQRGLRFHLHLPFLSQSKGTGPRGGGGGVSRPLL